jgi:hypothetical protein
VVVGFFSRLFFFLGPSAFHPPPGVCPPPDLCVCVCV